VLWLAMVIIEIIAWRRLRCRSHCAMVDQNAAMHSWGARYPSSGIQGRGAIVAA
jgi:hypothetical protein